MERLGTAPKHGLHFCSPPFSVQPRYAGGGRADEIRLVFGIAITPSLKLVLLV